MALGKSIRGICLHNLSYLEDRLAEEGLSLEYGLGLALENERAIARCFPELLEEIRGVAEGAKLPYERVLLETAFPFAAGSSSNCTVVSVSGVAAGEETSLVGRNYDFLSDFKRCNQIRIVTKDSERLPFVAGTITILGIEEGMNSSGLFVGDAGWEPKELSPCRGLSSRQIMELVLENCASVDEAIDFLRGVPKYANNAGTCYLLADRRDAVVMEMGPSGSCFREPCEGALVASDVFLTHVAEEMRPPEPKAFVRHACIRQRLAECAENVDEVFLRRLLSDHAIPLCMHDEVSTLRSVVAKLNYGRMLVADGHPCTSEFEEVRVPMG